MHRPSFVAERQPLASLTTLQTGGSAQFFARVRTAEELAETLAWADALGIDVAMLGGGSNVIVPDEGIDGLVIAMAIDEIVWADDGSVLVGAGTNFDAWVAEACMRGFAGVECLSGIPGTVGATPLQNVGAYGQDVSQTISFVRALHRDTQSTQDVPAGECEFAYRTSRFKRGDARHIVTHVGFQLVHGGESRLAYDELVAACTLANASGLVAVREVVLSLRRRKSMVIERHDPNRRSVGSFFLNPIVDTEIAKDLLALHPTLPTWTIATDRVKIAAAWLIEQAGFARGYREGPVGISSNHALAIVNLGGATSADVLTFANRISTAVANTFGVALEREPTILRATR